MLQLFTSPQAVIIWLALTICTMTSFWAYEATPGTPSAVAECAPAESSILLASERNTLVVFIHPKCVCTNATLLELRRIWNEIDSTVHPKCIFALRQPVDSAAAWTKTSIERMCREFPEATVLYDYGGMEAKRYGITTSGTCILYASNGHRIFCGGITASRGHQGPAHGQDVLLERMKAFSSSSELHSANPQCLNHDACPAFGCPLFSYHEEKSNRPDD